MDIPLPFSRTLIHATLAYYESMWGGWYGWPKPGQRDTTIGNYLELKPGCFIGTFGDQSAADWWLEEMRGDLARITHHWCAINVPGLPAFSIDEIRWRRRELIGIGGFSIVYQVGPNLVAKVGHIEPDEIKLQRYFAATLRALPVYDYRSEVSLSKIVTREFCPRHGPRREIVAEDDCACGEQLDVLLMAEADPIDVDTDSPVVIRFMDAIADECDRIHDRAWDSRPSNVAYYQGHLVALDFGEAE